MEAMAIPGMMGEVIASVIVDDEMEW